MLRDPTPVEQKVENYRRGIGVQKRAIGCYVLSLGILVAFIVEIARNWKEQGKPIATSPFNPFIGPTSTVLINVGARFTPCMKPTSLANATFACVNDRLTTSSSTSLESSCTLSDICGFGGFGGGDPDQKFRFVLPIFLHAGLIHIALNLLAQQTSVKDTELQMGTLRFLVLYIPAGIFGFILGGNFALLGQPSVGVSGCIFGTTGCNIVDLAAHWGLETRPWRRAIFILLEVVVGIGLGFIPNVDNFAHLGGLSSGLLLAILLYPVIHTTRTHRIVFYVLRAIALPLLIAAYVLLLRNFDTDDPSAGCSWCRYLSCWPTASNNHCKGTGIQTTTVNGLSPMLMLLGVRWMAQRWNLDR
ncbi:rhomboid-domain-containing protein [Atractiella rhizophila]|nr:rhomboid-domain-containing protein [Atractiella rhizophila]